MAWSVVPPHFIFGNCGLYVCNHHSIFGVPSLFLCCNLQKSFLLTPFIPCISKTCIRSIFGNMSVLSFLLPPPPPSWDKNKDYKIHQNLSECPVKPIEPAGHGFMDMARRRRHKRTLSDDLKIMEALREATSEDVSVEDDEYESPKLLKRDPLLWKVYISYFFLGLTHFDTYDRNKIIMPFLASQS